MQHSLPDYILSDLSHLLSDKLGLHFPSEKWIDLERSIKSISHLYHFTNPIDCIHWLQNIPLTQSEIERLACHFTVGETYFFRDSGSFEALENHILPKLIELGRQQDKSLRIWSAGCSTGEEAYSIAILLSQLLPDMVNWHITLLASDINIVALNRLQEGVYTEWSFRTTPLEFKEKYFKKIKHNRYEILPYLKKMVTATYLNLAEDSYPSLLNNTNAMDLILCRNTLMYFESYQAKKVIKKFNDSLINNGYLMVGASEHFQVQNTKFKTLSYSNALAHQKQDVPITPEETSFVTSQVLEPIKPVIHKKTPKVVPIKTLVPIQHPAKLNPETLELKAKSLANQGKLKEALTLLDEAIHIDKCNPSTHYLKALILQELGALNEATLELRKAIYLNPNFVLPYFSMANIAQLQDKTQESEKYLSTILSLLKNFSPNDVIPESDGMTVEKMIESLSLVNTSKH